MGHCKDCKHWEEKTDMWNKTWRECILPTQAECDEEIGEDGFAIFASTCDDFGLILGVKTGPMFGCIKFEQ